MSTLHTVNKSPFERNALTSCTGHLLAGDAVLMIEDAVLGARKGSTALAAVQAALESGSVYALAPDCAARGIKPDDLIEGVQLVDYAGFVDLVTQHRRTVAWL
ncbi:sulfur relay protein TusB/DsrH [Rhodomicrobium vannielii ATCC 17100]|jgi:tRNA 2-thiouridine synthesizing protein B|uniref:Sulfur relay protein TusB/DsrH n=1 Tax=Rhodomicrobium vannielii (strain ATCC 17100 / DSM 162 / LMG 4299 / NCIMB 10020 / ATH 3.1.1) TaxID=648757 RepID=E3HZC9_RHOVT|nr:sulfurtransferase complex subunit TusB [Rhodomicrobium vannielii]ADP69875.1 sulfur relay protein TusB/DsrH [Rhodomicrobium vannielii ATCC 17100]